MDRACLAPPAQGLRRHLFPFARCASAERRRGRVAWSTPGEGRIAGTDTWQAIERRPARRVGTASGPRCCCRCPTIDSVCWGTGIGSAPPARTRPQRGERPREVDNGWASREASAWHEDARRRDFVLRSGRACPTVELITDLSITAVTERGTHTIGTTCSEICDSGGDPVATPSPPPAHVCPCPCRSFFQVHPVDDDHRIQGGVDSRNRNAGLKEIQSGDCLVLVEAHTELAWSVFHLQGHADHGDLSPGGVLRVCV